MLYAINNSIQHYNIMPPVSTILDPKMYWK